MKSHGDEIDNIILDSLHNEWAIVENPGYFGEMRDELHAKWNDEYGCENWRLAWAFGERILEKPQVLKVYEDAYFMFFKDNRDKLDYLVKNASDVYDTNPDNVKAGLDYIIDDTKSNHIHDIAIRNAVARLGLEFKGRELMEVRWKGTRGREYSPDLIPFHLPELISKEEIKNYNGKQPWWLIEGNDKSIEHYYQQNKRLQVRKSKLLLLNELF